MVERTYIVTFDASDPTLELDGLKEFMQRCSAFASWWNHIPFVFLITTTEDAASVSVRLRAYTKDAKMLVMEVNPAESDGLLPEPGWNWIKRRTESRGLASLTA